MMSYEPAYEVRRECGHYVVLCNGKVWARVDNWAEVAEELELLEQLRQYQRVPF